MAVTSYDKVIVDKELLDNVANKIQQKASISGGLKLNEMDTALDSIASPDGMIDGSVEVINSNVSVVREYAFNKIKKLKSVNLPNITSIGTSVFNGCSILEQVNIPNCESIGSSGFADCTTITNIRLPKCKNIGYGAFNNCQKLVDLYFGNEGVVTIASSSAINFGTANTRIHVRSEYAEKYATATNWASAITNGKVTIVGDYSD